LGNSRELLSKGELDNAQKVLERLDESASAEIIQEKL